MKTNVRIELNRTELSSTCSEYDLQVSVDGTFNIIHIKSNDTATQVVESLLELANMIEDNNAPIEVN